MIQHPALSFMATIDTKKISMIHANPQQCHQEGHITYYNRMIRFTQFIFVLW